MKLQSRFLGLLSALVLVFGCSKNTTEPEDTTEPAELSEAEQKIIVSTELSESSGGLMNDLEMISSTASGSGMPMSKTAGFDTTITIEWITYDLSLSFYNERGVEQNTYVPGVTDSIVYRSALSGKQTGGQTNATIDLDTGASLYASDIKSKKAKVNGEGENNSAYSFSATGRKLNIAANSSYTLNNVIIDLEGDSYIPSSGTIDGKIKGKLSVSGNQSAEKNYSFTVSIKFIGGNEATVTLPNGKQFTVNLVTGQVS